MDSEPAPQPAPDARGFPVLTALASLATLFVFVGLMLLAYNSPNYLGETKAEPKVDPAVKLEEVKARNRALLDGNGAKMSVPAATDELVGKLRTEKDRLPFPAPPALPAAPDPKKADAGKKPKQ